MGGTSRSRFTVSCFTVFFYRRVSRAHATSRFPRPEMFETCWCEEAVCHFDRRRKPHQSSLRVAYTCHVFLGLEPESVGCDFKYKPRDAEQNGFNLPFFAADARKYLPGLFSRNKKGSERCPLSCLMFPWPDQPV